MLAGALQRSSSSSSSSMLSLIWSGEKLMRGESTLTWGDEKLLVRGLK